MDQSRYDLIGVKVSVTNMKDSINYLLTNFDSARNNYICVSNVHTTVVSHEDDNYTSIQNNSFMTLPDGKPLSVIGRLKGYRTIRRVTGPDFMEMIFSDDRFKSYSHFFYGETEDNLNTFMNFIKNKYPDLKISGYEHSVFRVLTEQEKTELKDRIKNNKSDFVWVAIGAPKQEAFCAELCKETNAVWIGVGGAFKVVSGIIPRAPKWMQNVSLEWLFRLINEPKRLYKRYLITNAKFVYYLIQSLFRKKTDE